MNKILNSILVISALSLAFPVYAQSSDPYTSQHTFKKDQDYQIEIQSCEKGRYPIVISHPLDMTKKINIKNTMHVQPGGENYYTVEVEEDIEGVFAQFCSPRSISPYFKKLKNNLVESK